MKRTRARRAILAERTLSRMAAANCMADCRQGRAPPKDGNGSPPHSVDDGKNIEEIGRPADRVRN